MVRVQKEPFDVGTELNALVDSNGADGAAVTFTGYVRGGTGKDQTSRMTLEHYPAMAQKELEAIEAKAHERWTLNKSLIIHRYGDLYPRRPDRPCHHHIGTSGGGLCRRRIPHGLAQNKGALLEARRGWRRIAVG